MKLKELIEKLSSSSEEEMNSEVKLFDVSTGNYFSPGGERSVAFEFGKGLHSEYYNIFYDSEGIYLNQ